MHACYPRSREQDALYLFERYKLGGVNAARGALLGRGITLVLVSAYGTLPLFWFRHSVLLSMVFARFPF